MRAPDGERVFEQGMWPEGKTIMMPKKLLKTWLKALRSGEYKQGRDGAMLDRRGQYCCLGVLCVVSGVYDDEEILDDGLPTECMLNNMQVYFRDGTERSVYHTRDCVDPALRYDRFIGENDVASHVNDAVGNSASFKDIADMIEQCSVGF